MHKTLTIATDGRGLYEFTRDVTAWVASVGHDEGLLTLFVRHTSCSLLIQENADPSVQTDLQSYFKRLAPDADDPSMAWITHRLEGPDDMPAHIKAAVLPTSLSIPVRDAYPVLGRWQGIYLIEHRTAPHRREVALHLSP